MDEFCFTLNYPLTDEDWDIIEDVDFDATDNITFHTRHGKEVEFIKRKAGEWKHIGGDEWVCPVCGYVTATEGRWEHPLTLGRKFCENCGADLRGEHNDG